MWWTWMLNSQHLSNLCKCFFTIWVSRYDGEINISLLWDKINEGLSIWPISGTWRMFFLWLSQRQDLCMIFSPGLSFSLSLWLFCQVRRSLTPASHIFGKPQRGTKFPSFILQLEHSILSKKKTLIFLKLLLYTMHPWCVCALVYCYIRMFNSTSKVGTLGHSGYVVFEV